MDVIHGDNRHGSAEQVIPSIFFFKMHCMPRAARTGACTSVFISDRASGRVMGTLATPLQDQMNEYYVVLTPYVLLSHQSWIVDRCACRVVGNVEPRQVGSRPILRQNLKPNLNVKKFGNSIHILSTYLGRMKKDQTAIVEKLISLLEWQRSSVLTLLNSAQLTPLLSSCPLCLLSPTLPTIDDDGCHR